MRKVGLRQVIHRPPGPRPACTSRGRDLAPPPSPTAMSTQTSLPSPTKVDYSFSTSCCKPDLRGSPKGHKASCSRGDMKRPGLMERKAERLSQRPYKNVTTDDTRSGPFRSRGGCGSIPGEVRGHDCCPRGYGFTQPRPIGPINVPCYSTPTRSYVRVWGQKVRGTDMAVLGGGGQGDWVGGESAREGAALCRQAVAETPMGFLRGPPLPAPFRAVSHPARAAPSRWDGPRGGVGKPGLQCPFG
jgi:hypothetical protein